MLLHPFLDIFQAVWQKLHSSQAEEKLKKKLQTLQLVFAAVTPRPRTSARCSKGWASLAASVVALLLLHINMIWQPVLPTIQPHSGAWPARKLFAYFFCCCRILKPCILKRMRSKTHLLKQGCFWQPGCKHGLLRTLTMPSSLCLLQYSPPCCSG